MQLSALKQQLDKTVAKSVYFETIGVGTGG